MLTVTNLIVIGLVLLIAYWWANQGVFSALLHLLCVIVAGVVALAVWEPLTVGLLLRGGGFDNYAWGVSLLGVFALTLLGLRYALDKLIPSNVDLPRWADLTFGGALGLGAGILTMGIFIIGAGFIQSHQRIMGYIGYGVNARDGGIAIIDNLWPAAAVHYWTSEFFNYLSVGALSTSQPLAHYQPELHKQASLVRSSYDSGAGQLSLLPDATRVTRAAMADDGRLFVVVQFESGAMDFGQQLTLSRAQVRLLGNADDMEAAPVVYPDRWTSTAGTYRWDDPSHYATSTPGQSSATIIFEFPVPRNVTPRFIQIRNTRYTMPRQIDTIPPGGEGEYRSIEAVDGTGARYTIDESAPSIQNMLEVTRELPGVAVSTNMLPRHVEEIDRYITTTNGRAALFTDTGIRPARNLQILGLYEMPGTKIVQLEIERGTDADIFGYLRNEIGDDDQVFLVDDQGRPYFPIGYIRETREGTYLMLAPGDYVKTYKELPALPSSGTETLHLVFSVTQGARIVGFRVGEVTVGGADLVASD